MSIRYPFKRIHMTDTHEPWAKPKGAMFPWSHSFGSLGLRSKTNLTSLTQNEGDRETRSSVRLTSNRWFPRWLGGPILPSKPRPETPKARATKDPAPYIAGSSRSFPQLSSYWGCVALVPLLRRLDASEGKRSLLSNFPER
jgi:hypothetical protein